MNKLKFLIIVALILSGCAGIAIEDSSSRFVNDRNYDVGRRVDWSYATPSQISSHSQKQDKYLYKTNNGCSWVYYVNNETKIVDSWEYISSPEKCRTDINWFGGEPW